MPNYDAVINITNSFNAATKLRDMNLGKTRLNNSIKSLYQSPDLLGQALKTIVEHSPNYNRKGKNTFEKIDKGTLLLNTYKDINSKFIDARTNGFNTNDLLWMARTIKPIMPSKHQKNIDKFLQIYNILKD